MKTLKTPNSTMIASMDYDDDQNELVVTFSKGARYSYVGVPSHVFDDLVKSVDEGVSIGKSFNEKVKHSYPFIKL